jgi:hypothetical protein
MKKLGFLFIALVGLVFTSNGQAVTAIASASATIVTPIAITNTQAMLFGNIAVGTSAGSVTLDYADARTKTGGVTLPAATGTVKTALFTVTGDGTNTFSIGFPASINLSDGTHTMALAPSCEQGASSVLAGGTAVLKFGGTLTVGASQAAGAYVNSTDLVVTVNYN